MVPTPGQAIGNPACGTGGFLLATHDCISQLKINHDYVHPGLRHPHAPHLGARHQGTNHPSFDDRGDGERIQANGRGEGRVAAQFIIYTNGDVWRVQRRRGNEWVPVSDLPKWQAIRSEETIVPLLRGIKLLEPLLRQLDRDVVGNEVIKFLGAMQELFSGSNLITRDGEPALLHALDNLLRGICDPSKHVAYRCGKLSDSFGFFEKFRRESGLDVTLPPVVTGKEIRSEIHALHVGVNQLLDIAKDVPGESSLLLRLGSALLAYGMRFEGRKARELKISPELYGALRDYLNHVLILQLNVSLPDMIDVISVGDMRSLCNTRKNIWFW